MGGELSVGVERFSMEPRTLEEAMKFADLIAKSDLVPKDYKGNPGNVLIAIQWGAEIGLKPLQALQNIAVINGRPSLWGDAPLSLVQSSGLVEDFREDFDANSFTATCSVKRKGQPTPIVRSFSQSDATKAGLWGRNTWASYPKRMCQMRARAFALRDGFPDVLKGMAIAEEQQDAADVSAVPLEAPPVIAPPQRLSQKNGDATPPSAPSGDWVPMTSKYAGKCSLCEAEISVGQAILYNRDAKKARCVTCTPRRSDDQEPEPEFGE